MKSTMKFALSLLMGCSVLTLTACDNQEAKTPEKMTALSENKAEPMPEKVILPEPTKDETVSAASQNEDVKTAIEKTENNSKENIESAVEKSNISPNLKENVTAGKSERPSAKMRKKTENRYLKEQKALLKVLESQYQQIRCTAEAATLGENSFCRQEERRLLSEIKRVKGEIRLNQ
ncbi:hypothetical protein [Rodentibacter trehalosifermentans]|uniref:Lipoprotein n=1 Tax=Rodentibacter trehalosifermentans TaxID=1908263 RepID=A0A1V3IXE6_9PAST|nr:hypothetical protein [Rodentibacter trehalosifermentans]OOF46790.1 hypothetical protein BKK51_01605 [Rodentibacter trehalosifermentans]OOF49604.1 hypothetical protein BKK52_03570 [Rodentibacter trehalosifermentans]OOF53382.1 hypothetical protein BKK53_01415 [Rodentibacter trehalosifermentans]